MLNLIVVPIIATMCLTHCDSLIRSIWINYGLPIREWVSPFSKLPKRHRVDWNCDWSEKKRITVLQSYTSNITSFASVSAAIMREYCKKHNYGFREVIDTPQGGRNRCWDKVRLISRELDGMDDGDWVFWIDSDAAVSDFNKRLESIVGSADMESDILICTSLPFTRNVNTGAMMIRKSNWSIHFMKSWWNDARPRWLEEMCHEQSALDEMIARDCNYIKRLKKICLFEYNEFNSTYQHNLRLKGRFVQHYRGCSPDKRRAALLEIALSNGVPLSGVRPEPKH